MNKGVMMSLDKRLNEILKPWCAEMTPDIEEAILAWVAEVIGKDENVPNIGAFNIPAVEALVRDRLRAEQRKRAGL